jgi:hypothetical protein
MSFRTVAAASVVMAPPYGTRKRPNGAAVNTPEHHLRDVFVDHDVNLFWFEVDPKIGVFE